MSFRSVLALAKDTLSAVGADRCIVMSAAIAYYAVLSLPPLLALTVALAGALFGADVVRAAIVEQVASLMGAGGADQVRTMIDGAQVASDASMLMQVITVAALVFGATGVFAQLQAALNRAWDVRPDPEASGVRTFLVKRLLSFGMVLTIALLLLVSLVLSAVIAAVGETVLSELPGGLGGTLLQALNTALDLSLTTLLFAAIFKVLPDAELRWRDVWMGALMTAVLFTLGKLAIGIYLGTSDVGSAYGAAGSVVLILVWIYYSTLILLVGAEFTQVYVERRGGHIQPKDGAVRVVEQQTLVDPYGQTDANRGQA